MPSYQPGNKTSRDRPWLARVTRGSRWTKVRVWYLGYYRTKAEAKAVEDKFRKELSDLSYTA